MSPSPEEDPAGQEEDPAGAEAGGPQQPFTLLSRMRARRRDEAHRSSTSLELFFDLSFAVAVAQAGQQLVHALAAGEPGHGITGYLLVFFAIWWACVNFTWFASAYDTDGVPYRLITLLQITGVLVLAAAVPRAFSDANYTVAVTGYLIMRVALTLQWLRAAHNETGRARKAALTYAAGLVVVQGCCGVLLLLLPSPAWEYGVGPLIVAELAVPAVAERAHETPWHPGTSPTDTAGSRSSCSGRASPPPPSPPWTGRRPWPSCLPIAFGGLVIVFTAFWIYFATTPIET